MMMKNNTFKMTKKNLLKLQAIVNSFNDIYNILLDCPCDYDRLSHDDSIRLINRIDNVFVNFIDRYDSVS